MPIGWNLTNLDDVNRSHFSASYILIKDYDDKYNMF